MAPLLLSRNSIVATAAIGSTSPDNAPIVNALDLLLPSLRNGTDIIAPSVMFCIAISSGIQCSATARIIFVERESGDCAPSWFPPSGYDLTGRCVEVIIVPGKQCSPRDRVISLRPFALQIMRTQEFSCLDELYAHFKKKGSCPCGIFKKQAVVVSLFVYINFIDNFA